MNATTTFAVMNPKQQHPTPDTIPAVASETPGSIVDDGNNFDEEDDSIARILFQDDEPEPTALKRSTRFGRSGGNTSTNNPRYSTANTVTSTALTVRPSMDLAHHNQSLVLEMEAEDEDVDGVTSDEDDDTMDAYEQVLGMRHRSEATDNSIKAAPSTASSSAGAAGRESPVRAPCPDLHISPNFAELFRVFEKPKQSQEAPPPPPPPRYHPRHGGGGSGASGIHQDRPHESNQRLGMSNHPWRKNRTNLSTISQSSSALALPPRSPRSLADSEDAASSTSTEITSNTKSSLSYRMPQVDILTREIDTLKSIMREDSLKLLMLQKELEVAQQREEQLMQDLSAAQDLHQEHEETIAVLKLQVDEWNNGAGSGLSKQEHDQIREENALFAGQIVENEKELKDLKTQVAELVADKSDLVHQVAQYKKDAQTERNSLPFSNDKQQVLRLAQENTLLLTQVQELEQSLELHVQENSRLASNVQGTQTAHDHPDDEVLNDEVSLKSQQSVLGDMVQSLESRLQAAEEEREKTRIAQEQKKRMLEEELNEIKKQIGINVEVTNAGQGADSMRSSKAKPTLQSLPAACSFSNHASETSSSYKKDEQEPEEAIEVIKMESSAEVASPDNKTPSPTNDEESSVWSEICGCLGTERTAASAKEEPVQEYTPPPPPPPLLDQEEEETDETVDLQKKEPLVNVI